LRGGNRFAAFFGEFVKVGHACFLAENGPKEMQN
jgi:hypothetical protein